jgi:ABC-2 type transport system permease protein
MNRLSPQDASLARPIRTPGPPHAPRVVGAVNGLGLWTLYIKEVRRFLKVFTQTLIAPIITTMIFLAIFSLALGGAARHVAGIPFVQFLAPGLAMMVIVQNSFANTTSSMMISKMQGNIVDVLMPPLSPTELVFGYVMAGATRGMAVGLVTMSAMACVVPVHIIDPLAVVYFAFMASLLLSLLGLIGGIWAEKYDHVAAVTNFVIMPLSFLSGTFYSIERLPGVWNTVAHFNPFFFMIDGFRSGFIHHADSSPLVGALVLAAINAALWALCTWMFRSGYKLKA